VIGRPRLYEPECESTQSLLLGSDLPEGAVAVTDHQTGGRGRLGRKWVDAPSTAVLVSVLLRPPPERRPPELSLVAALAVAEAVELATGLSAQIKWPNDVMLDRWKVAGILAELRDGAVVVGIGVNVNQTREQLPADAHAAASLRTVTGREYERSELLETVLGRLDAGYERWREAGLEPLYGEIGARDFVRGRRLTLDGRPGTGVMILRDGRLEVAFEDGERTAVESGVLHVER
jgi:BirA family transcriptional regulator, biotin operon repressor / biotin---[acetyl-CoA-carboxylase] ligase